MEELETKTESSTEDESVTISLEKSK
jgi:hypothetical protein